ncbi:nucleotide disphospho-sugar-binding domain-containing protein [Micromonospora sp. NPDC002575]|uniref:nucleotide disphospho-sugar-binding domain-containing protein n=1 Tax=Micromonospora sp. NPDC002575 TaxID=3364222 RepID=UPI0036B0AF89
MRVLFTSATFRSHLFPLVPLAWALRAAGHDVRVAVQPPLVRDVLGAGLPAVEAGAGPDFMSELKKALAGGLEGPGGTTPSIEQIVVPHVRIAEAFAADLVPFARRWSPDLVVADPAAFVAPVVARAVGAPLVLHTWGPMPDQLWADLVAESEVRQNWPKELLAFLDRWDVPLGPDYADLVIDPCPDELLAIRMASRHATRYVPYNGSALTPSWLDEPAGRPRVCISWGTTSDFMGAEVLRTPLRIVEALADMDVEVVAALGKIDRTLLGAPRDNVRVVDWLPLSMLLPTCDALINQGGPGTVLAAVASGVPQLVVPQISAQPLGAELLTASGAGLSLTPDEVTAESIGKTVAELLDGSSIRAAAQALAQRNAARPDATQLVPTLQALADSAR